MVNRITKSVCASNSIMMLGNNIVGSLNIGDENISILDVDTEFSFDGFMDLDGGLNINISSLIPKVSVE